MKHLNSVIEKYVELTPRSREIWESAKQYLPGGDSRNSIFWDPYPIYIKSARGPIVTDVDDMQRVDFINTMSKPESVNLDNLVQLYRLNNGGAAQQANPSQPSQEFKQMQNAQQVPSPMGVLPSGQSGADTRTAEDKIMDTMIGNFNSKNPWK